MARSLESTLDRRDALKNLGLGALLGASLTPLTSAMGAADRGQGPLKITKVRAITTNPQGQRLVVIKVETSEPGLYGLGCGTYNQRPWRW